MAKKNMQSIVQALTPVAEKMPTQAVVKKARSVADEPTVQISFKVRKSIRKQLMHLSQDADMTIRGFILDALRERGVDIDDEDIMDMRKEK